MLPDARGSCRKERWASEKLNLNSAIQVGPVHQHGNQFISTKRLDDLDKGEFIRTDGDGFDYETLSIFLAPLIEFTGRLRHGHDVHRESIRGENHAAEFPSPKMACDEKRPIALATSRFQKLETAPLNHQFIEPVAAAFCAVAEIM